MIEKKIVNKNYFPDVIAKNTTMKKGDKVHWNWGKSQAEGTIKEKSDKTITKKIKGTEVKRKASKEEPAYVVSVRKPSNHYWLCFQRV